MYRLSIKEFIDYSKSFPPIGMYQRPGIPPLLSSRTHGRPLKTYYHLGFTLGGRLFITPALFRKLQRILKKEDEDFVHLYIFYTENTSIQPT